MRSVRSKLVGLVLACAAPAIASAVLRANDAKNDLLEQVQRRVAFANRAFSAEVAEDLSNSRVELSLAAREPGFRAALAAGDAAGLASTVKALAAVDTDSLVVVAGAHGVVATSDADRSPRSFGSAGDPFRPVMEGQEQRGLVGYPSAKGQVWSLVSAIPVSEGGRVLGALAMLTPVDGDYLEHIEGKINADLALRVNEQVVAACPGHPDPQLESHEQGAVLERSGGKLFALSTFKPELLQAPGQLAELTVSRDVTALADENRSDLLKSLAVLGAMLIAVLSIALRVASRMGHSIRGLSDAAGQVAKGKYVEVPPLATRDELEGLARDFNAMVQGLKERDHLKDTFGRYVTRQVADHLLQGNVALGGELVPVTVLFSDIRSFTTISERMEPRALLDFLNVYFSGMVESVMVHHGVVDKFIGDAIMAVFGAPVPHPDDPLHAVKAALEMRARLAKINVGFKERGLPEIRAGIGLHSGMVVAGNMGHEQRKEYTVIGDTVNLASRLESMTKELQCDVILSEDLYAQVKDAVVAEPLRKIKVKGREQEVMVYRLLGLKGEVDPNAPPSPRAPTAAA